MKLGSHPVDHGSTAASGKRRQRLASLVLALGAPLVCGMAAGASAAGPCDADPASLEAQRTVVQWTSEGLKHWRELDGDGGTCVVDLATGETGMRAVAMTAAEAGAATTVRDLAGAGAVHRRDTGRQQLAGRDGELAVSRARSLAEVAHTSSAAGVRHRLAHHTFSGDLSSATGAGSAIPERDVSADVFGADNRARVTNTTQSPFNTMTFVLSEFPDGSLLAYSGFLVAPTVVLTSAQALYQQALGGDVVSVEVYPGQTQASPGAEATAPYGSLFGSEVEVPQAWVDSEAPSANYGAIFLDQPFAGINNFLPVVFDLNPPAQATMSSYDESAQGEIDSLALWTRTGATDGFDSQFVFHLLDDDSGAIGAPIYDASQRVFAIDCCVTRDHTANVGVRFTGANETLVTSWIESEPVGSDLVPDGPPLVLRGGRFEVRAAWRNKVGTVGDGTPVQLTSDTGYFWFFDDANVELVVKVLNGCSITNHYWVYVGGLTDVEVAFEVVDKAHGNTKVRYENTQGIAFQPITDTEAFATCP